MTELPDLVRREVIDTGGSGTVGRPITEPADEVLSRVLSVSCIVVHAR